jgi:sugar/nucleoside kinase (ribokinase family)
VRAIAVVGHLSLDVVDGAPPRIGGAPWYAARALRVLGRPVGILAKCGEPERRPFLTRLATLGTPATVVAGGETSAFTLHYDGREGEREITVESVGEPWRPDELGAIRRAVWVHVAPLLRSDFPAETMAALARDRRLLLDGQGLVRVPEVGPLRVDASFDREILAHVSILKLAEEEASLLEPLEELGVPEIVVTLGARGSRILVGGKTEEVPACAVRGEVDPTGAGDAFAAVYLAGRAAGHAPVSAARRATALVGGLLAGRTR